MALVTGISGQDGASFFLATLLLESMRFTGRDIKGYNASSSDRFGDTACMAANDAPPFRQRSPYAVPNVAAFWQAARMIVDSLAKSHGFRLGPEVSLLARRMKRRSRRRSEQAGVEVWI